MNALTHNHITSCRACGRSGGGGKGLTSHKCHGWPGEDEFFLLKLGCLQSTCRHLVSNPVRYIVMSKYLPLSTKQCRERNILSFVTEVIKENCGFNNKDFIGHEISLPRSRDIQKTAARETSMKLASSRMWINNSSVT